MDETPLLTLFQLNSENNKSNKCIIKKSPIWNRAILEYFLLSWTRIMEFDQKYLKQIFDNNFKIIQAIHFKLNATFFIVSVFWFEHVLYSLSPFTVVIPYKRCYLTLWISLCLLPTPVGLLVLLFTRQCRWSPPPHSLPLVFLSWIEELAKADTCARDRRALQRLALNVHIKFSDLTVNSTLMGGIKKKKRHSIKSQYAWG